MVANCETFTFLEIVSSGRSVTHPSIIVAALLVHPSSTLVSVLTHKTVCARSVKNRNETRQETRKCTEAKIKLCDTCFSGLLVSMIYGT
jgi:hypothetical protein